MGYLISETTREEREQIVREALGNIDGQCDGCMSGLADMYQDYIDGKREIQCKLRVGSRRTNKERGL